MKIPAFVNPAAGTVHRVLPQVDADPRFELRRIAAPDLASALREAVAAGGGRVLVVGGDGTVATAASALVDTGVVLGVLPAGTLNHFAKDLGIPPRAGDALAVAAHGAARAVNVGLLNGRVFLNTSSIGAYVPLARVRDRLRPWMGYPLAVLAATLSVVVRLPTHEVRLTLGDGSPVVRTPLLFVGVGERDLTFGGLGERTDRGRGGLHMIMVEGKARRRMLAIGLASAVRGIWRVARTSSVQSHILDGFTVELAEEALDVALDGETVRMAPPLHYTIRPGALNVAVPGQDA